MLRLTPEEYAALTGRPAPKQNKYHARQVTVDGVTYASQHEYNRWLELVDLQRAGLISDLRRQVPFVLVPKSRAGRAMKYIADAVYVEDGREVIEDAKSEITRRDKVYRIKRRLMAELGYQIREV